ncbi:MAG: hypothetical protein GTN36_05270 [Candidatus Aenigmarchaeota archaeon]|nr:hypothetical protein [Candidatus Aenigmarchaeota archaeon]
MQSDFFLEGFYKFKGCKNPIFRGKANLEGTEISGMIQLSNEPPSELKGKIVVHDNKKGLAFLRIPEDFIKKSEIVTWHRTVGHYRHYLTLERPFPWPSKPHEGIFIGREKINANVFKDDGKLDERNFLDTLNEQKFWMTNPGDREVVLTLFEKKIPRSDPNNVFRNFGVLNNPIQHPVKGVYNFKGRKIDYHGKIEVEGDVFIGRIKEPTCKREVDIEGKIHRGDNKTLITFRKIYGGLLADVIYSLEKTTDDDSIAGDYGGFWETAEDVIETGISYKPKIGEALIIRDLGRLKNKATLSLGTKNSF